MAFYGEGQVMKKLVGLITACVAVLANACSPALDADPVADTSASVVAEKNLYVGICAFSLLSYDTTGAFRFYVQSSFAPDDAGGQLTLTMRALPGWDFGTQAPRPPATVTAAEAVGPTLNATSALSGGRYTADFGTLQIVPVANPITGGIATVEKLTLDGPFAGPGQRFCAGMAGHLTAPLDYTFDRNENTCLFLPIADGDPLPDVASADFTCP
jgi:hypothetical protein